MTSWRISGRAEDELCGSCSLYGAEANCDGHSLAPAVCARFWKAPHEAPNHSIGMENS